MHAWGEGGGVYGRILMVKICKGGNVSRYKVKADNLHTFLHICISLTSYHQSSAPHYSELIIITISTAAGGWVMRRIKGKKDLGKRSTPCRRREGGKYGFSCCFLYLFSAAYFLFSIVCFLFSIVCFLFSIVCFLFYLGKRSTPCPRREASMNQKLFIRVNDCAPSFGSMFACK